MEKIQIFIDTDVAISSLLSTSGASFQLLQNKHISPIISKGVVHEIKYVSSRLNVDKKLTTNIIDNISVIPKSFIGYRLLTTYTKYTTDEKDAHIIAAADISKSKFLITYNTKHFLTNKIKSDLNIIVLKPGSFLQYLRSQGKY